MRRFPSISGILLIAAASLPPSTAQMLLPNSPDPVTVTWSARDAQGVVWAGGPDSLTATPIETPMLEAWAHFSRPLHSAEFAAMLSTWEARGSMSFLDPDTVLMAPDSTLLHIPSFTPFRAWPDLWAARRSC